MTPETPQTVSLAGRVGEITALADRLTDALRRQFADEQFGDLVLAIGVALKHLLHETPPDMRDDCESLRQIVLAYLSEGAQ